MNETKRSQITPRQAEASRANGSLSQGPTTEEGKAISSMNAVKFGFFARNPLLPGESETEFAAFRARLLDSFRPVDGAETLLVDRIVDSGWRLRRFPAAEAALYSAELLEEQAGLVRGKATALIHHRLTLDSNDAQQPEACRELLRQEAEIREELNSPQYALGRVFRRDARTARAFTGLSRCEMILERVFYRALHELQSLRNVVENTKRQNEPGAAATPTP